MPKHSSHMPAIARTNIAGRFLHAAEAYGDRPAAGMAGEDAVLTYSQLATGVRRTAGYIRPLKSGQTVGLLSENRPEWCKIYLAILACGGTVVPVDPLLKEQELRRVLEESGIGLLFVSPRYLDQATEAIEGGSLSIKAINLEVYDAPETPVEPELADDPDAPAVMIFTSGTTGKSKKVILTHGNLLANIEGFSNRIAVDAGSRFLSVLPLHHTFEATCGFLFPLTTGLSVYYVRELNSREILNGFKKHHITHFLAVPLIFEKMYHGIIDAIKKAPVLKRTSFAAMFTLTRTVFSATGINIGRRLFTSLRKKAGIDSVHLMISGGAPLPMYIATNFTMLGFEFLEGYGLTETSPVISVNPAGKMRFGSVGPPLDNIEVKIDNPDEKGNGEILVRGPSVTPGYKDNPEATAELFRDGWMCTGDIGCLDEDGYLYIKGRMKCLIVSAAGKNIYPEEIEAELLKSPLIYESLVYGREAISGREEVAVIVYPDFEMLGNELGKAPDDITDEDLHRAVDPEIMRISRDMADYKRIRKISYIDKEFAKTSTRKIKRHLYIHGGDGNDSPVHGG